MFQKPGLYTALKSAVISTDFDDFTSPFSS